MIIMIIMIVTIVVNDMMMIFLRSVLASARATTTLEEVGGKIWTITPKSVLSPASLLFDSDYHNHHY